MPLLQEEGELLLALPGLVSDFRSHQLEAYVQYLPSQTGILVIYLKIYQRALQNLLHLHICLHLSHNFIHDTAEA